MKTHPLTAVLFHQSLFYEPLAFLSHLPSRMRGCPENSLGFRVGLPAVGPGLTVPYCAVAKALSLYKGPYNLEPPQKNCLSIID